MTDHNDLEIPFQKLELTLEQAPESGEEHFRDKLRALITNLESPWSRVIVDGKAYLRADHVIAGLNELAGLLDSENQAEIDRLTQKAKDLQ